MASQRPDPEPLAAPANIVMLGGPTDWSEAWYSRHQLTAGLARTHRVLLVDPPRELRSALAAPSSLFTSARIVREPVGTERYAHPGWLPAVHRSPLLGRTTARLRAQALRRWLVPAAKGGSIAYVWHPDHADEMRALESVPFVYHAYDRYDLYTGSAAEDARRRETWLARNAAFCVGASSRIVEHLGSLGAEDVRLLRHGVDPGFFDEGIGIPADLERLPRPRIGLVASLSDAVDYLGLTRLATERPDWSLVIVGKQAFTDDRKRAQYEALVERPNVHAFGFRPQKEVPGWLKGFDAALISYDLATWAPYNQPLKLYEYLASGTPVVASRIQAAEELGELVACVDREEAWAPTIERAMAGNDAAARERRRRFADENRWERRVATLDDWLAKRFGVPGGESAADRRGA